MQVNQKWETTTKYGGIHLGLAAAVVSNTRRAVLFVAVGVDLLFPELMARWNLPNHAWNWVSSSSAEDITDWSFRVVEIVRGLFSCWARWLSCIAIPPVKTMTSLRSRLWVIHRRLHKYYRFKCESWARLICAASEVSNWSCLVLFVGEDNKDN